MIPLHDDMTISFVNYELKVNLVPMTAAELRQLSQEQEMYFKTRPKGALGFRFDAIMPPVGEGSDVNETNMLGSYAGDNDSTMIKGSEFTAPTQKMQVNDTMVHEDKEIGKVNNAPIEINDTTQNLPEPEVIDQKNEQHNTD